MERRFMWSLLALLTTVPSVPIATLFQSQLAEVGIEVEIKSMEKMEWYASYMNPAGWDITAMTAGFFNYAMPQCWFSAMMAQMPEDVSISLLDNSDEFISCIERV